MSQPDEQPAVPDINYHWVEDRLAERGVDRICPRCHKPSKWVGLGQQQDAVAHIAIRTSTGDVTATTDLYGFICLNCGFLALHGLAPLLGDAKSWPHKDDF